jgi:DNA invertase Pin-like site-specific DNA recombinase
MIETSPQNRHLGYARVSSYGQALDAQLQQFRAEGCTKVYREKAGGARADRAPLRRDIGQLAKGDLLMVTRLDRLACSIRHLLNTLATITGRARAFVRCMTHGPTRRPRTGGRLMPTVLGRLAEFERDLIRTHTGEGRARAVANGVRLGRKPKLTDHQKREAIRRRDHGEETLAEIGQSYNVSGWTIARLAP